MIVTLIEGRILRLPDGVTVGDEFRVAGRVRVTAISETIIDASGYDPQHVEFLPSERTGRAFVMEMEIAE